MARIRSVHPGLFTDETFMTLSMAARVLMIGIWTECDDHGVFEWKPITLKARILPADNVDMDSILSELIDGDAVMKFTLGGKDYGAVRNFGLYQKPKKPSYRYTMPEVVGKYTGFKSAWSPTSTPPVPHQQDTSTEKPSLMEREMEKEGEKKEDGGGGSARAREPVTLAEVEDALPVSADPEPDSDMGVPIDLWRPSAEIATEIRAHPDAYRAFVQNHLEAGTFSRDWPALWRKAIAPPEAQNHLEAKPPARRKAPPRVETNKRPEPLEGRKTFISDEAKALAHELEVMLNVEHLPITVGLPLLMETWLSSWPRDLIVQVITDVMRQRADRGEGMPATMKYFETPIARAMAESKRSVPVMSEKDLPARGGATAHDRRQANSVSATARRIAAKLSAGDEGRTVDGSGPLRIVDGTVSPG